MRILNLLGDISINVRSVASPYLQNTHYDDNGKVSGTISKLWEI